MIFHFLHKVMLFEEHILNDSNFRAGKVRWRISCQMQKKMQWDLSTVQQLDADCLNSNTKTHLQRNLASSIVKFKFGIVVEIQS